jgi:hypothetical protein
MTDLGNFAEFIPYAVSFWAGAGLATLGNSRRNPVRWELDTRPTDMGVAFYAVKGKKETCLHRVAYNRPRSTHPDVEFDEQFAEALGKSRSLITSLNAADKAQRRINVGH